MDQAAIKAYSSVIADAAEDSEPQTPVQYHQVITEEDKPAKTQAEPFQVDPMGSMIQNEISAIKDASIAAAKEKMDEWRVYWCAKFEGAQMNKQEKIGWDEQTTNLAYLVWRYIKSI